MEMTTGAYEFAQAMLADGVKPRLSMRNPGYEMHPQYDPDYDFPMYQAVVTYRGMERHGFGLTWMAAWDDLMNSVSRFGVETYGSKDQRHKPMDLTNREAILAEMTCEAKLGSKQHAWNEWVSHD